MRASLECAISSPIIKSRAPITHKEPKSLPKQFEYVTISLARRRLRVRHDIALHECRLRWFLWLSEAFRMKWTENMRNHRRDDYRTTSTARHFSFQQFCATTKVCNCSKVLLLLLALPACLHNRSKSRSNSSDNSSLVNCLLHVFLSYWKSCSRWWCFLCLRKKCSNAGKLHRKNDEISFAIRVKLHLELDWVEDSISWNNHHLKVA